ncbi:MAG: hypothetical protein ACK4HE_03255 [Chitinophagaceae bacterium]
MSPNEFKNKRIAIIGPASSAYSTGKGKWIDNFDIVVRVNKAPKLLIEAKFTNDIGIKCDVLFHSFFENTEKGGGPLDFKLFDSLKIKYVVNPIPGYFGWRVIFNFYKKYLLKRSVYTLPSKYMKPLLQYTMPYRPTTGLSALYFLMEQDFLELYISGFTFFKTPYGDGYRDALKDINVNKAFIDKEKQHNIDLEFSAFLAAYHKHIKAGKRIVGDDVLGQIIKEANFKE